MPQVWGQPCFVMPRHLAHCIRYSNQPHTISFAGCCSNKHPPKKSSAYNTQEPKRAAARLLGWSALLLLLLSWVPRERRTRKRARCEKRSCFATAWTVLSLMCVPMEMKKGILFTYITSADIALTTDGTKKINKPAGSGARLNHRSDRSTLDPRLHKDDDGRRATTRGLLSRASNDAAPPATHRAFRLGPNRVC